jgi:carbonic anhydrase
MAHLRTLSVSLRRALWVLALPLAGAVLWPALARAQAPAANDRVAQQLRDAVDRVNANAARPMVSSRSGGAASAPAAETPSITLSIDRAGETRLAPSAPAGGSAQARAAGSAPAAAPAARPATQAAPAARAAPATAGPVAAPATASATAATAVTASTSSTAGAGLANRAAPRAMAEGPRAISVRPEDRYRDEQARRQYERARAIANGLPVPASARLPREASAGTAVAATTATTAPTSGSAAATPSRSREPLEWSYQGAGGPAAWASLKPEYQLCGNGQRQSPIHIEPGAALQGPNEALGFDYGASGGTVLHDGRTIRVEVDGNNLLQVRGASYRLVSFDFQHPAEEMVGHQGFAMGLHLLHRDAQGRNAIVAVLLQPGEAHRFIDQVWTYIPLDVGDRVRMPPGSLDMAALLPTDQRYYQFFGSMTTPPCEEGVLWMVLKQPVSLSAAQLRLFAQMFPANARPVQALNGRIVRDAQ